MERTVPHTASEEIELYQRTYYSLLRSTDEVPIRALEEVHLRMGSLLHPGAAAPDPDAGALIYSVLRLPDCIFRTRRVVLGQSPQVFRDFGLGEVETWERVAAKARRRPCFFDGQETLACYIASRTDIDDVLPLLTALQVEWNKLYRLLQETSEDFRDALRRNAVPEEALARALHLPLEDLRRLRAIWGAHFATHLDAIARQPKRLVVRLLSGSLSEYRRATLAWWEVIERRVPDLRQRPVYFVSSNTHSLPNLLAGFALRHRATLTRFVEDSQDPVLQEEWAQIQEGRVPSSQENFFYYALKKYQATPAGRPTRAEQRAHEESLGILRIPSEHSFDVEAQVIDLSRLRQAFVDQRLRDLPWGALSSSPAYILNIDYPLGMGAYHILTLLAHRVGRVLGVYIMGKAATLNGAIGDVMIPNVVHDEHSQNTYLFANPFTARHVAPFLTYGTVLDNQKAVTVRGTFLQTARYMDVFYREGYTDIEMEAGPYLSAMYEMVRPKRYPVNEIVNLHGTPFEVGILHYASDTPLSKGKNLGAGSLSYRGMDPTYATAIAILRRIVRREVQRIAEE